MYAVARLGNDPATDTIVMMARLNGLLQQLLAVPGRIARIRARAQALIPRLPPLGQGAAQRVLARVNPLQSEFQRIRSKLRIRDENGNLAGVPVVLAIVGGVSAAAIVAAVGILMKKLEIEERIISGLESGAIDANDIDLLERQRKSADQETPFFGELATIAKVIGVVLIGGLALQAYQASRPRRSVA